MLWRWKNATLQVLVTCVAIVKFLLKYEPKFCTDMEGATMASPTLRWLILILLSCWRVPNTKSSVFPSLSMRLCWRAQDFVCYTVLHHLNCLILVRTAWGTEGKVDLEVISIGMHTNRGMVADDVKWATHVLSRTGPRQEPWGTPKLSWYVRDHMPSRIIRWEQPER